MKLARRAVRVLLWFLLLLFIAIASFFIYLRISARQADKKLIGDPRPLKTTIVLISIDGLRGDAIEKAGAANLAALMRHGSSTLNARTVNPSWTVPAHVSLGTGVVPDKHGILSNDYLRAYFLNQSGRLPTILDFAKARGLSTTAIIGKSSKPFRSYPFLSVRNLDQVVEVDGGAIEIAESAAEIINENKPAFIFIYFSAVDLAGHEFGWLSSEQMAELREIDLAVGMIADALGESLDFGNTYLIVTSDHGGHDKTHGTDQPEDMTIPWIFVGPNVRRNYRITGPVSICDTPATIVRILDARVPPNWDGKPVIEAFLPD